MHSLVYLECSLIPAFDWLLRGGNYGCTLPRGWVMDFMSSDLHHIFAVGTCGLFLCALIYFLHQLLYLYFNRNVLVECWFCQSFSTVKVTDRNAFFCIFCKQYNGFTESGDYNRPLPAQYEASLNPHSFTLPRKSPFNNSKSNILCGLCAQQQAHKIDQLARFEPSSEANWDRELNQFKIELERRCVLCPSCTIKVHRRINQIDAKILPKVLSWWRNRNHNDPITDPLPDKRLCLPTLLRIILFVIRIATTLLWLSFGMPPFLDFLQDHVCHLNSSSSLKSRFEKISSYLPQHSCGHIAGWRSALTLQPNHALWGYFLCAFGHLVLLLQIFRPSANPVFTLIDFIFIILAADLAISCQGLVFTPTLLLATLLVVGSGVFFYNWFSHRKRDVKEQNRKLTPLRLSPASPRDHSFANDTSSALSSRLLKSNASGAHSLSLDGLSLHSPSYSTAYSNIFSPPTLVSSPLRSRIYTSNVASDYTHRRGGGDGDVNEVMSHFTSVSQCSIGRRGQSKRQHRKRRQQQPVGLLRWFVYLLFGRLENWEDLRAELVCLLNAVLVAVLLILICHLFHSVVPALWNIKL